MRRTEKLQKLHKKKEHARTRFYNDSYKFVKDLFAKEKNPETLKASKQELEEQQKRVHQDTLRHEQIVIPQYVG